ncbi:hypothetical protein Tco_0220668, partial [Tanacetum coccineum]
VECPKSDCKIKAIAKLKGLDSVLDEVSIQKRLQTNELGRCKTKSDCKINVEQHKYGDDQAQIQASTQMQTQQIQIQIDRCRFNRERSYRGRRKAGG